MHVSATDAKATVTRDDDTYHFCSEACRELFEARPEQYLAASHPHLTEHGGVSLQRLPSGRATGEFEIEIDDPAALGVGDRVTFTKTVTDDDVRAFARATSDTNALHLSDEFAEKTRFDGRIVHGTLISGLISAALACFPRVTIYRSQNLEFVRPASIGDTLTASCEIVETIEDEYRLTTRVENESSKVLLHGTATVLIDDLPE